LLVLGRVFIIKSANCLVVVMAFFFRSVTIKRAILLENRSSPYYSNISAKSFSE